MAFIPSTNGTPQETSKVSTSFNTPLYTLTTLFFMWGFITCMNDILIPHLKELFQLSYFQSMLVQFCFFGAYFTGALLYFVISYFKGDPINRIGYKYGILLGLCISAVGCFLFYPASVYSIYGFFLLALFVLGLGFTILQIAANPYVSLLGDEKSASSRLNLAQAFNSAGTTLAPILGGYLIFEYFATDNHMSGAATRIPYVIFGILFILIALAIYKIKLPTYKMADSNSKNLGALKFPQLKKGIFAIFFYVGAEVAIGSLLINFFALENILGLGESEGKNYLALYWGGAMIGRFLGALTLNNAIPSGKKPIYMIGVSAAVFLFIWSAVSLSFQQLLPFIALLIINLLFFLLGRSFPARTLFLFAIGNIILLLIAVFGGGALAMWALIGVGLFNSIMWSNIFTLSISGLGSYTSQGSSLLVMAILGGALIPLLQGWLADGVGIQYSFLLPALCYLYIVYFGWFTRKIG